MFRNPRRSVALAPCRRASRSRAFRRPVEELEPRHLLSTAAPDLTGLMAHPKRPLLAVMGGAKVSDKINFINALLGKVDHLLIGGKMGYTFQKAQGISVGNMQIADLTSVAIDSSIPNRYYSTQYNTGAALVASGVGSATTMGLTGFIGIPDGDRVVVGIMEVQCASPGGVWNQLIGSQSDLILA